MNAPASNQSHRAHLRAIAVRAMRERGLEPNFPADALAATAALTGPSRTTEEPTKPTDWERSMLTSIIS